MKNTITTSLICTMALLLCLPFATARAQAGGGIVFGISLGKGF